MKKLIDLIIKFDSSESSLTNEEWYTMRKMILYMKLFFASTIILFTLAAYFISVSFYVYFFYFFIFLYFIIKIIDVFIFINKKHRNE